MNIVVIIGPSGAGKSTVAHILQETYGFHLQRTVTTRPQRDKYDTDHIFVNEETYVAMKDSKAFFGTLDIFEHHYGLPRFDPRLNTLLLLRAPAVRELLSTFPDAHIIQIEAPLTVLATRLSSRGTQDRIDETALQQEIQLGQTLAEYTVDSSALSAESIASQIVEKIAHA